MSGTLGDLGQLGDGTQIAGFGGGASDPYMMELMRRRAMADALAKQGMAEAQRPMTHWLQPLGAIAQQGVAAWRQGKADDELLTYAKGQAVADQEARRGIMAMLLGGGQGATPAPQPQPVAPSQGSGAAPAKPSAAPLPIAATTLAPEAKALLTGISGAESPGYNVRYGGSTFDGYGDHPRTDVPIMTGPMKGQTSSAAGRYQFLGSTWDNVKAKYGLPDFSPASQDLGAWQLARDTYQAKTGRDLAADMKSQDPQVRGGITNALAGVWPSLPGGNQPNGATNGFWQRVDAAMGGAQPNVNVSTTTTAPAPPMAAGGPPTLDKNRMLAAALAAGLSGRPGVAPLGTMLAGVARAIPDPDRELVQVQMPDGSKRFVPRPQAAGMASAPDPYTLSPGQRRYDATGNVVASSPLSPGTPTVRMGPNGPEYFDPNNPNGPSQGAPVLTPDQLQGAGYQRQVYPQGGAPQGAAPTAGDLIATQAGNVATQNARGPLAAKAMQETVDARNASYDRTRQYDNFAKLAQDFDTGKFADTKLSIGQVLQSAGVPDAIIPAGIDRKAIASAETMRSITNHAAMSMIGPGGMPANNFSEADRGFVVSTVPGLMNTPGGNAKIMAIARAVEQRKIELGDAWLDWSKKNGNTLQSWDRFQAERAPEIIGKSAFAGVLDSPATGAGQGAASGAPTLRWNVQKGAWE